MYVLSSDDCLEDEIAIKTKSTWVSTSEKKEMKLV